MKSFYNYSKNRILFNLLKIALVGLLGYIGINFLFIPKVSAATSAYWGETLNSIVPVVNFKDCLTSRSCNGSLSTYSIWGKDVSNNIVGSSLFTNARTVAGSEGIMVVFGVPQYNSSAIYSASIGICTQNSVYPARVNNNIGFYFGNDATDPFNKSYRATYYTDINSFNVSNRPFSTWLTNNGGGSTYGSCRIFTAVVETPVRGKYIGFQFTTESTTTTNYWLVGYSLDYLGTSNGLTSSDISNVINNSGLATANDIEEVNESVQEVKQELSNVSDSIDNVNDTLTDSNSSGATSSADNFFSGFTTDTYGLTSIITAPLNLINQLTSSTCSPLGLEVPFLEDNNTINLPCMTEIYEDNFGTFYTIYNTITFGLVAYWVCVRIFNLVKDFKNPDHDEIEVLDL